MLSCRPGRAALALGLATSLAAGALRAEADGPDYYAVRDVARNDVLNIRVEPSASARKIGEIPPDGSCIRNLGCTGGLAFEEFTNLSPEEKVLCRLDQEGLIPVIRRPGQGPGSRSIRGP